MIGPLLSDYVWKSKTLVRLFAPRVRPGKTVPLAAGFLESLDVKGNLELGRTPTPVVRGQGASRSDRDHLIFPVKESAVNMTEKAILLLRRRPHAIPGFLTALVLLACFAGAQDTGSLVLERCQDCHEMDKTCLVQSDDTQWWQSTVLRMVEYKSELLTADEASAVSAFLADPQKRASVCTPK
jgi:hypothetical protein